MVHVKHQQLNNLSVGVFLGVFLKVILSSPCLWACFHPLSHLWVRSAKFYIIWLWNAENHHLMHKVRDNYSSCRCRSSENICSSRGSAQEKMKDGVKTRSNSAWNKKWCISEFDTPLKANVLLYRFCLNLTRWTKLKLLVPCCPDFTENSIKWQVI